MAIIREQMEHTIRSYFDACNQADREGIMSFFVPQGTHYFPEGSPFGVLRGAAAIADCWVRCVAELGSYWTVDNFVGDPNSGQAVIEWSHFKRKSEQLLRGDEWYRFNEDGKIVEIRAYYACPTHPGVAEHRIGGFDYAGRGYPLLK
ncbi:MAG: nuclear transport factor 2 family protein [Rhodocyclaceae bacterium]|nr:MAG: nuclear transport factor 2 family protein [Rhodocyclaceae bacterium]